MGREQEDRGSHRRWLHHRPHQVQGQEVWQGQDRFQEGRQEGHEGCLQGGLRVQNRLERRRRQESRCSCQEHPRNKGLQVNYDSITLNNKKMMCPKKKKKGLKKKKKKKKKKK